MAPFQLITNYLYLCDHYQFINADESNEHSIRIFDKGLLEKIDYILAGLCHQLAKLFDVRAPQISL
jgi:hypothetical protein